MRRALALALALAAGAAAGQEVRETDIFFSDPANLLSLLDEAERAARAGDPEAAIGRIGQVLETARGAADPALRAVTVRALALRARLRLEARERRAAAADLEEALRLDPALAPAPAQPKAFVRLLEETRRRMVGRLSVHSDPPGATVVLEGVPIGRTPLVEAAVASGRRYLRIERPGFAPAQREVEVTGGRPVRVEVTLERRAGTFLVLTDADGARVSLDGAPLGVAERPDPETAERLVAAFNLPIDAERPPPLLLWTGAAPGAHRLALSAPCREPVERAVEIPESADAMVTVTLPRATGGLRLAGENGAAVRIDGERRGLLPLLVEGLCPGPHRIETEGRGRRVVRTAWVEAGRTAAVELAALPLAAVLGEDDPLVRAIEDGGAFHAVAAALGSFDAASLGRPGEPVDAALRDRIHAAAGADLLVWRAAGELCALAAGSPRAECWDASHGEGGTAGAARLSLPLAAEAPGLGAVAVDTDLRPHPLLAALSEAGPAQAAGLRVGDELLQLGGVEVTSVAGLASRLAAAEPGRPLAIAVRRHTGDLHTIIVPRLEAQDPDFPAGELPANVAAARLTSQLETTAAPALALALGKAWLALGHAQRAYETFAEAAAAAPAGEGIGPGTAAFYQALAADLAGDAAAARDALRRAVAVAGSRLFAPEGPAVAPLARDRLAAPGAEE